MVIVRNAAAGTMESSDAMVLVSPAENGILVELESTVYTRFGKQMETLVRRTAEEMGAQKIRIRVQDFGALDCTLRARVRTAIRRAAKEETR